MAAAMIERKSRQCHWDMLGEGSTSFCHLPGFPLLCAHEVPPAALFLGHSESPCTRLKLTVSSARVNANRKPHHLQAKVLHALHHFTPSHLSSLSSCPMAASPPSWQHH